MNASTPRRWVRGFLSLAVLNVVILAVLLGLWIWFAGWPPPPPFLLRDTPFGIVLGFAIGGLAYILMPVVAGRVWPWHPILRWACLLATIVTCAVVGTLAAATVPYLAGLVRRELILVIFRENIRGTVPVTLVVGVLLTIFGSAKSRLEATELALRTQQLERERAEKLAAEAQLASLSSRVQPHFLFNTLNSISALIREHPEQAERTVERLSALLRASLESKALVSLEEELKLVTDYLEIQRTRLGERLRYDLSIAPSADAAVPLFAVQTIVENALKHVGGQRQQGVAVHLSARRSGGDLIVDVTDDGPGFGPERVTAGHGLDTLQSRLRAQFGAGGGLEFLRDAGGMTVRLRVPVV